MNLNDVVKRHSDIFDNVMESINLLIQLNDIQEKRIMELEQKLERLIEYFGLEDKEMFKSKR